jgi:hypothetical protein
LDMILGIYLKKYNKKLYLITKKLLCMPYR